MWAAERQGEHVPERVTGVDVTKELFKVAATHHIPVYCLGAAPGVAQRAVDNLAAQVGELNIAGIHDGFFDSAEEQEIINTIGESKAKLVFCCLRCAKARAMDCRKIESP